MNAITIKVLWDDNTGQYCSEVEADGRRLASCYSEAVETVLVGTLRDKHCTVHRDYSRVLRSRRRAGRPFSPSACSWRWSCWRSARSDMLAKNPAPRGSGAGV